MWWMQYLGQPYSFEQDCYYWVRRIQSEQFGRELPLVEHSSLISNARLMQRHPARAHWVNVELPCDGDMVWMSYTTRAHHVGVWAGAGVLHALENIGVIHSAPFALTMSGWKITGIERYCDE